MSSRNEQYNYCSCTSDKGLKAMAVMLYTRLIRSKMDLMDDEVLQSIPVRH